jgi:hypothetical protein
MTPKQPSPEPQTDIPAIVDDVLIDSLPPGLKDSLDQALALGHTKAEIMRATRVVAERSARATGDPQKGQLITLAVEAYLERREATK